MFFEGAPEEDDDVDADASVCEEAPEIRPQIRIATVDNFQVGVLINCFA